MSAFIIISDMIDPNDPQGRTYRQVNAAKSHAIPIGALVEISYAGSELDDFDDDDYRGVRLYVVSHSRDCDQTPLYNLAANRKDTNKEDQTFYNRTWINGFADESLIVIALPVHGQSAPP